MTYDKWNGFYRQTKFHGFEFNSLRQSDAYLHQCISKVTNIGSDNGLSSSRHLAIIWINAEILLIRPLGTNSNEILIKIPNFSFMKMHLKILSAKWRPFCPGGDDLTLKWLGHFFQNGNSFSDAVHLMCNIFIWNWSDTMNVSSALRILMAWCFSTRASVATVLTTHPCISRCLRVNRSLMLLPVLAMLIIGYQYFHQ